MCGFLHQQKGCSSVAQIDNCAEYKILGAECEVVFVDSPIFILRCSHIQARILELVCKYLNNK